MAFKRDQSGWKACRLWLGALALACAIGWAGSFLPGTQPAKAQFNNQFGPQSVGGIGAIFASGTTAATLGIIPAVPGKVFYLCGFSVTATATAAAQVQVTTVGLAQNLGFLQPVLASPAVGEVKENFAPCLPASGANTAISVNSGAAGTGGVTNVSVWGFYQ